MQLKNIVGFRDTQGISKKGTGSKYQIGRLYWLKPMKGWENEHGRSLATGFSAEERDAMDIDLSKNELVTALLNATYPCDMDAVVEPHPEDPLRNIIVSLKPSGLKDITSQAVKQKPNPLD